MKIYDRIMGIGTKMTDMDASTYQGAFIGKISYTADIERAEAAENIVYSYGDVKENAFMYILSILGNADGIEEPVEKMTITLVKASDKAKDIKRVEKTDYENEEAFHTFSKDEVYSFSKETGDENKIHLTDHPVVQGMLLLRTAACKLNRVKRLDVKFVEPSYAEEKLMWGFNGKEYVLFADGYVKASFKAITD
ncbi:MAG: hypothetical protein ACI4EF_07480 [Coprococcus sp.]